MGLYIIMEEITKGGTTNEEAIHFVNDSLSWGYHQPSAYSSFQPTALQNL
jgi:hypothetical protein